MFDTLLNIALFLLASLRVCLLSKTYLIDYLLRFT